MLNRPVRTDERTTFFPLIGYLLKILALGLVDALAIWSVVRLATLGDWVLVGILIVVAPLLNWALLSRGAYPLRYLLPGLVFMFTMVLYPIGYTVYVSTTNYGTGHILTKEQAVEQIQNRTYLPDDAPTYAFTAFGGPEQGFRFVLVSAEGVRLVSQGERLIALEEAEVDLQDVDGDGSWDRLGDLEAANRITLVQNLSELQQVGLEYQDAVLRLDNLNQFVARLSQYEYDPAQEIFTDARTGMEYRPVDGFFVSAEGERLRPGFRSPVGIQNFVRLFSNPRITGPFLRVFVWTVIWAFASVATTFTLGLGLALILNDPYMKLRNIYRMLLIVPYAMPAFVSALIWKGLFNTEVGVINSMLTAVAGLQIPWLQDPIWAKVALVIVNLWLGFPYMMIISLGALQSISPSLYEAAYVDGARFWDQLKGITLPILMTSIAPLLVSSFALNFNNFTLIYLLTEGRPPIAGAQTPAGATDILISYTYRLAFESGSGTDFGLASAVAIIIFVVIGSVSWFNFRFVRRYEELGQNV